MKITVYDVINNTGAKLLCGSTDTEIKDVFINTKNAKAKGTFFGIHDNYKYYKDALLKGAKVLVLPNICKVNINGYDEVTILIVSDVLKCMQDIAAYKRSVFKGPVIGITGSVGKTTTKQYVSNVLLSKYKVLKTMSNRNGQIGVPLTILSLKDEDVMVLEMGISKTGEMSNLTSIAKPDIVIITNVFNSHIENFSSKNELLKEKLLIINDNTKKIIVNGDYELNINNNNVINYSIDNPSSYKALNIKSGINTTFDCNNIKNIMINGPKIFIYNALPAIIIGDIFGMDEKSIKQSLKNTINEEHRLNVIKKDSITIIDDTYNASLESVLNALDYMSFYEGRKVVILADILELGKEYKTTYKQIADKLTKISAKYVITVGNKSKYINKYIKSIKNKHYKSEEKLHGKIEKIIKSNDVILIKGSHGMKLFNLVNYIIKEV